MRKFFATLILFFIGISCVSAKSVVKSDFNSVISDSEIDRASISISIKDVKSGKSVYKLNDKILMHPASVQKVLTIVPAMEVLGDEYEFKTILYKRSDDKYLIKLGADPYLSSKDLKQIVRNLPYETKEVDIDDSILESKSWGEGWQWDDDLNNLMPKFNSYNLDNNLIKITVMPTEKGNLATIINPSKYPLVFFNNVITGDGNNIQLSRDNSNNTNTLALNGIVKKPEMVQFPINNLKRYFNVRLKNTLADRSIYLTRNFEIDKVVATDLDIANISHPINQAVDDILKNSNNMVSETLIKLAGNKAYGERGSDVNGIKVFNEYCEKNKLDNSRIKLADASGVSKNNLVTSDFISEFLVLNKDNKILEHMAIAGEGTLENRMIPIGKNLRAKTGTLSDISAIAGYLTTKKGQKYAFCIIINDPSVSTYDMKNLEDYLIREAYLNL